MEEYDVNEQQGCCHVCLEAIAEEEYKCDLCNTLFCDSCLSLYLSNNLSFPCCGSSKFSVLPLPNRVKAVCENLACGKPLGPIQRLTSEGKTVCGEACAAVMEVMNSYSTGGEKAMKEKARTVLSKSIKDSVYYRPSKTPAIIYVPGVPFDISQSILLTMRGNSQTFSGENPYEKYTMLGCIEANEGFEWRVEFTSIGLHGNPEIGFVKKSGKESTCWNFADTIHSFNEGDTMIIGINSNTKEKNMGFVEYNGDKRKVRMLNWSAKGALYSYISVYGGTSFRLTY